MQEVPLLGHKIRNIVPDVERLHISDDIASACWEAGKVYTCDVLEG